MIIVIQCKDQVGLVAAISGVLAKQQLNIISMREHVDKQENRFYMRLQVEKTDANEAALEKELQSVLNTDAVITINPLPQKKVVVLVTKEYHCLADILIRNYFGTFGASVLCVIGNHDTLQDICKRFDIPFFLISHEQKSKEIFEHDVIEIIAQHQPDYVVLAKFMRILSPNFVARFPMKLINIHHSFLPAFCGCQSLQTGI